MTMNDHDSRDAPLVLLLQVCWEDWRGVDGRGASRVTLNDSSDCREGNIQGYILTPAASLKHQLRTLHQVMRHWEGTVLSTGTVPLHEEHSYCLPCQAVSLLLSLKPEP